MKPIIPMEPKTSKEIPSGDGWVAQVKWDGVRIGAYYDGKETRLYNRKAHERTLHFPELMNIEEYCKASSVILDGEVIALGEDGLPSFHEVMRRDGLRRMDRVEQVKKVVPITFMIFDILYWDGQWITSKPLKERQEILNQIIKPQDHIQLVTSHSDAEALFEVMNQQGMEGIVVKRDDSPYLIGEKRDLWLKIKNYSDLIAVVGGFTVRDGIANALLLGLYDQEGKLWYIGHAGTAKWTKQEWRDITEKLNNLTQSTLPFAQMPARMKDVQWVKPLMTVKVQFIEWTKGRSLRQPSIQGLSSLSPGECLFVEENL